MDLPREVVSTLQVLRSYYNMLQHSVDLPVDLPATCYNRKTDWVLPGRNACFAHKRMEPLHQPGLLLYAFNRNDFRTFPDIVEIDHFDWQTLEAVRLSKAAIIPERYQSLFQDLGYSFNSDITIAKKLADKPRPRIACLIDVFNWSWHIATKHMFYYWPEVCGDILDAFLAQFAQLDSFDFAFVFVWANKNVVNRIDPSRSALFLAGGKQLSNDLLDAAIKRFNIVCARNRYLAEEAKCRYPDKQVFILTNGVDVHHFKPQPKPHNEFTVGWVGRPDIPLKRFDLAEKIVQRAHCRLKVASFEQRIPHEFMPDFYNAVDVLLVTSEAEAHPLPVYEAMSCGIPVVTTDVGDVRDVITDGENGYILPVDAQVDKFARCINELKDENVRKDFGRRARERIVRDWSWETKIRDYKEFLRCVLE